MLPDPPLALNLSVLQLLAAAAGEIDTINEVIITAMVRTAAIVERNAARLEGWDISTPQIEC